MRCSRLSAFCWKRFGNGSVHPFSSVVRSTACADRVCPRNAQKCLGSCKRKPLWCCTTLSTKTIFSSCKLSWKLCKGTAGNWPGCQQLWRCRTCHIRTTVDCWNSGGSTMLFVPAMQGTPRALLCSSLFKKKSVLAHHSLMDGSHSDCWRPRGRSSRQDL